MGASLTVNELRDGTRNVAPARLVAKDPSYGLFALPVFIVVEAVLRQMMVPGKNARLHHAKAVCWY